MNEEMCVLKVTLKQAEFLKKAIDGYCYIIFDALSVRETEEVRKNYVNPIYNQMPDSIF